MMGSVVSICASVREEGVKCVSVFVEKVYHDNFGQFEGKVMRD